MVKIDVSKVSIGDVIVIKDKSSISTSRHRKHLQENIPYCVSEVWSSSFSIDCMGKDANIFESDFRNIEFIYAKNDVTDCEIEDEIIPEVGDNIVITYIDKITGASNLGFKEGVKYEITKVESNYIYIVNDKSELLIEDDEFSYITHESKYIDEELESILKDFYDIYKQNEIDRMLDIRDFEGIEKLIK